MKSDPVELDLKIILGMVRQGSSVLDLGCGDGKLGALLMRERKARVQGIEIDEQAIYRCVARGLSVLHGDIDTDLPEYGDKAFDYVILAQSFQQVKKPDAVLREALRVGKQVIVSIPNFAHYSARTQIFFKGRTPVTPSLPYEWHDTPNLHFLSLLDFITYCRKRNIRIEEAAFVGKRGRVRVLPNVRALTGIFLLSAIPEDKNGRT
jgi:methionine biosynthesis protein MetW